MKPRPRTVVFSRILRGFGLVSLLSLSPITSVAEPTQTRLVCLGNISQAQREHLSIKLRRITGWSDLHFDRDGRIRLGGSKALGGSQSARSLLENSASGEKLFVLEDASQSADVAFARVVPGRWRSGTLDNPAYIVQIDFSDFKHVMGDQNAMKAFDVGWVLLHELDHVVNNSVDASVLEETGTCEENINRMRRESGLPERTGYFFTSLPRLDTVFVTTLVRLAFEREVTSKKRRYWLVWDAALVGGLQTPREIAALR